MLTNGPHHRRRAINAGLEERGERTGKIMSARGVQFRKESSKIAHMPYVQEQSGKSECGQLRVAAKGQNEVLICRQELLAAREESFLVFKGHFVQRTNKLNRVLIFRVKGKRARKRKAQ
jgi:hypothetical protein